MAHSWGQAFHKRMMDFATRRTARENEVPVSVKVGVTSGCFHREHSPDAYELIDKHLASIPSGDTDFAFEEHESGPEILVYLTLTTAGVMLAKSVIDLITAIVKARAEGIQGRDHPRDPLRLVIRRTRRNGDFEEEIVMHFEAHEPVDKARIEKSLIAAATRLLKGELPTGKRQQ